MNLAARLGAALALVLPLAALASPPADGPAAAAQAGSPGGAGAATTVGIDFEKGAGDLSQRGEGQVNRIVATMRDDPDALIRLRSRPDELGSSSYEIAIEQKRLAAVRAMLQAGGVPPARIRAEFAADTAGDPTCLTGDCPANSARLDAVLQR